jgi:hypothetical protein
MNLTSMGNLVEFVNGSIDDTARTQDVTVNYVGGFFTIDWAAQNISQAPKTCKMIDLNLDDAGVGRHIELVDASWTTINLSLIHI